MRDTSDDGGDTAATDDVGEATVLVDERHRADGRVVHVRVVDVPASDAYPEGVKYRMHYGTVEGRTILRYDNSHGVHERHRGDAVERLDFPGWRALLERFRREVNETDG